MSKNLKVSDLACGKDAGESGNGMWSSHFVYSNKWNLYSKGGIKVMKYRPLHFKMYCYLMKNRGRILLYFFFFLVFYFLYKNISYW